MRLRLCLLLLLMLLLAACGVPTEPGAVVAPTLAIQPTATEPPPEPPTEPPTVTPTLTPSATALPTSTPTAIPTITPTPVLNAQGVDVAAHEAELLQLINTLRVQNNCLPLALEPRLEQAAQAHAEDMRNGQFVDHLGSDGAQYQDRLDRVGYPYQLYGENIAAFFATPQEVMQAWTEGDEIPDGPHRTNILNCLYTETGIGLAYRDDGYPYWVLNLANRQ